MSRKFDCIPNAYQRAEWKTKTKSLSILGWGLFAYTCVFSGFAVLVTPIFLSMVTEDYEVYQIYSCRHCLIDILWIIIGLIIFKCLIYKNRISGIFFMIHGLVGLIIVFSNTFHLFPVSNSGTSFLTSIYLSVFLNNVFLYLGGYFFNRNLKYGISRYVNIAITILVVTSICYNVILYNIMGYRDLLEQGNHEKAGFILTIITVCTWPFIYTAYFMIARALSKMQNYPIYKV